MTRGTVAVTDHDWYEFLRRRQLPEVNFWTPSDHRRFSAPEFSPFFFKLKAPHNAIGGFGYFARWATLQGLYWLGVHPCTLGRLYAPIRSGRFSARGSDETEGERRADAASCKSVSSR